MIPIPPIPEDLETSEWQGAPRAWLESKAERRQGYKPRGLLGLWTFLRQMGPRVGVPSITRSIAGEFKGIKPLSARELEAVLPFALPSDPELDYRVQETWESHVWAYQAFLRDTQGAEAEVTPVLTAELRALIEAAVRKYDEGLLGADQRGAWESRSIARAAGIGIFYCPWNIGTDPMAPGVQHLGHDLPWKNSNPQRFADLHFQLQAAQRKAGRR